MRTTMFRYSKPKRKNVLCTTRVDNQIYFGISRCNLKAGDSFDRDRGRKIAEGRAIAAVGETSTNFPVIHKGICIHSSGLRGMCEVSDVTAVLEYFRDVDKMAPMIITTLVDFDHEYYVGCV